MNLVRWQKSELIIKLRNEWYCFSNNKFDENFLYLVSNKIYQPSYISLETALSYYGIIPEGVFIFVGITTQKTNHFNNKIGNFTYKNIKPNLFFGYSLVKYDHFAIKIADLEKTIIDCLYYNRNLETIHDFYDLRWNKKLLIDNLNFSKLNEYSLLINSKEIYRKLILFKKYLHDKY